MRVVNRLQRFCNNLSRKKQAEDSLDAELRTWVDDLTERNLLRGMTASEARRQALLGTGGVEQIKEQVRESWLGHGVETVVQDIRYALRTLLKSPGYTGVVLTTLALGIGATLTMYGLMRAVLWRPLPYPGANRIVVIQVDARHVSNVGATPGEVLDLNEQSRSLEAISMINAVDADLELQGDKEHVEAASVSDNFLPLLGARPQLGRTLHSLVDDGKDQVLAIVISNDLWRRRFSADPKVVGKTVLVNNLKVQIAGVLAPGFRLFLPTAVSGSEQIDVWFPASLSSERRYRGIPILARLKPGVPLAQANAELNTLAARFEREYPDFYSGGKGWQASPSDNGADGKLHLQAWGLQEEITREARPALFLLAAGVGFVLLIACVNAANLMLARGSARQHELEIRGALGAGKLRIVRQLLTESLLLAVGAAMIGLLCAQFGLLALAHLNYSHIPLQSRITMDATVTVCALLLIVVTTTLFGLLPALRMTSDGRGHVLHSTRTQTGSRRLQRMLVIAEVALSILPLACSGLMLRSFVNLRETKLGFNPADVLTVQIPFNFNRFPTMERQWVLLRDVIERVRGIPGIQAVSAAAPLPLAGDQQTRRVGAAEQPDVPPTLATQQGAIPGYLRVMGTPLLAGRDFNEADMLEDPKVTIIDDVLAHRLWPQGAIGKHLVVYRTGHHSDVEVIGVTAAVRATRVRDENIPHFVLPNEYPETLVIKSHRSPASLAPQIAAAIDAAHTGRAMFDLRPMADYVSDSIGDTRFILLVLGTFAAVSVLLAAIGLYGTLVYLTARRTREFGIRMALGSSLPGIVAIVLRESLLLSAAGAVSGLAALALVTRVLKGLLYGVKPLDGSTLFAVVTLVGIIAFGAASVPAWRAARIDPQLSLRAE